MRIFSKGLYRARAPTSRSSQFGDFCGFSSAGGMSARFSSFSADNNLSSSAFSSVAVSSCAFKSCTCDSSKLTTFSLSVPFFWGFQSTRHSENVPIDRMLWELFAGTVIRLIKKAGGTKTDAERVASSVSPTGSFQTMARP